MFDWIPLIGDWPSVVTAVTLLVVPTALWIITRVASAARNTTVNLIASVCSPLVFVWLLLGVVSFSASCASALLSYAQGSWLLGALLSVILLIALFMSVIMIGVISETVTINMNTREMLEDAVVSVPWFVASLTVVTTTVSVVLMLALKVVNFLWSLPLVTIDSQDSLTLAVMSIFLSFFFLIGSYIFVTRD